MMRRFRMTFSDGASYVAYARALCVPYGIQVGSDHYPDLSHCPCHNLRMDAEADFSLQFRNMDPETQIAAIKKLTWNDRVAISVLPSEGMTFGDYVAIMTGDVDRDAFIEHTRQLLARYTADDWKTVEIALDSA